MNTEQNPIVITHDLSKTYGKKRVVDRLNFTIPRGSICGFLGANGAGKTTTIKMLLGLVKPSQGGGKIFGKDLVKDSIAIRQKVGFLSQSPNFYNYLTARETLRFVMSFFCQGSNFAMEAQIEKYLEFVGLSNKADRPVGGFSGGERQRLGIAQAAIHEPELIILDEPASALDPLGRRDVLKILESFCDRSTVFYSTHILDDVQRVSDWIVIMQQGRLVTQGAIDKLLTDRKLSWFEVTVKGDGQTVSDRLKAISWIERVLTQESLVNAVDRSITRLQIQVSNFPMAEDELLRLILSDSSITVTHFGQIAVNLEDVFVNLIEGNNQHDSRS